MDATKTSIVNAAFLPISIIIIGIGNADFSNMEILDGDEGLNDAYGNKCQRDLVQFVPFNKFRANPSILAQKVLEELPNQLCEYMRLIGKKPNPPQEFDINTYGLNRSFTGSSGHEFASQAFASQTNIIDPSQTNLNMMKNGQQLNMNNNITNSFYVPSNPNNNQPPFPNNNQYVQGSFSSSNNIPGPYGGIAGNTQGIGASGLDPYKNQNPMGIPGGQPQMSQTTMMFGQSLLGGMGFNLPQNGGPSGSSQVQMGFGIPQYGAPQVNQYNGGMINPQPQGGFNYSQQGGYNPQPPGQG